MLLNERRLRPPFVFCAREFRRLGWLHQPSALAGVNRWVGEANPAYGFLPLNSCDEQHQFDRLDGDDTLWKSQDYFDEAQAEFERILGNYIDLADARVHERLYDTEKRNLALFGYGVKGMVLSMLEAAIEITGQRIAAKDVHRIVELGKSLLQHSVELLPGIRDAVTAIAADFDIVLITKGDLFHQEAKVRESGLAGLFGRIEIVSEKDAATYARVLSHFDMPASRFVMIGNSLRSDIAPVLELGGWGVHVPYHTTWAHESEVEIAVDAADA